MNILVNIEEFSEVIEEFSPKNETNSSNLKIRPRGKDMFTEEEIPRVIKSLEVTFLKELK